VIKKFKGAAPSLAGDAWVAETATVIGNVTLAARSSIWYGTVVRGDVGKIDIGEGSNIQDNSVIHVETNLHDCKVGKNVTVGHMVMLHGCTIGDGALIGIGSIVLNGAEIGENSIIGAGSIVTQGAKIPPGVLALGTPCKVERPLTPEELTHMKESAVHYQQLAVEHRG
jgi:carbonic anhydrase/acetyltransferase-like protein (isoleucine patch superfamily)